MKLLFSNVCVTMLATTGWCGVIVDRIAVIVDNHVIKSSDIELDIRMNEFLNRETVQIDSQKKKASAERLIDQELIRREFVASALRPPPPEEASRLVTQLERDRFGGSRSRMEGVMSQYRVTGDQLKERLLWQLTVVRFIEQRFRGGIVVTDEDVRAYHEQHLAELQKQYPLDSRFETLESTIRKLLEAQRIDEGFDRWLAEARGRARIEYRQGAFI